MRALSIGSADAFILVYDVCDATTFEEVRLIRDQIHECKRTAAVPIVVVGNRSDVVADSDDKREVSVPVGCPIVAFPQIVGQLINGFHMDRRRRRRRAVGAGGDRAAGDRRVGERFRREFGQGERERDPGGWW